MASRRSNRGGQAEASTAGRGKRARTSQSSSGIPSFPGYEEVNFATHAQRNRFSVLEGMPMNPTRFLSRNAMTTLGLDEIMINLFAGTGLRTLYGMQVPTYRALTLEFLSSLHMDETTNGLTFRIQNVVYSLTLEEFGNHLGLARSPIIRAPDEFSGHILWGCISTAELTRGYTNMRVNSIHHPALRIWFRTLIGTIFGRSEFGTLNLTELSILGSFLNVQRGGRFALDLPYLVAKHMMDVAENRIKTIEIGGLITYLVNSMGFNTSVLTPVDANERWIDCEYLRAQHRWLARLNRAYSWKIAKDPVERLLPLPSDRLPALYTLRAGEGNGLPSYLLPAGFEQQQRGQGRAPPPLNTNAGPSFSAQQASSSHQNPTPQEIETNRWNFNNSRSTHIAVNNTLESYWRYHGDVTSGLALGPHPTYYRGGDTSGVFEEAGIDQNAWGPDYHRSYGGYGGQFLDEFGRINISGDVNGVNASDEEEEED